MIVKVNKFWSVIGETLLFPVAGAYRSDPLSATITDTLTVVASVFVFRNWLIVIVHAKTLSDYFIEIFTRNSSVAASQIKN